MGEDARERQERLGSTREFESEALLSPAKGVVGASVGFEYPKSVSPSPVDAAGRDSSNASCVDVERGYGWLGAVIPFKARRFRVVDPVLGGVLVGAGADIVETEPDVEIASGPELRGDAALSIAVLGHPTRAARPLPLRRIRTEPPLPFRIAQRIVKSLAVRLAARRARRYVRRLGYGSVSVYLWDQEMAPATSGTASIRARVRESLPQRALVIGQRIRGEPTVLEDALREAHNKTGLILENGVSSVRGDVLIVQTEPAVLRLSVGSGRLQISRQREALSALQTLPIPDVVRRRVPWEIASGRSGIAEWSLERRLPGERAQRPVTGVLLADCIDFLSELHSVPNPPADDVLPGQAELVAEACSNETAEAVRRLSRRLAFLLAGFPRGFAHGDFFYGNLLVQNGRLVGVVDWDAAGRGRLPLIDLLHLRLTSISEMADVDWGPLLLRHLVPWARAGGDDIVRAYCERAHLRIDSRLLEGLVAAYWFDYVSHQLATRPHNRARRQWVERNVELVSRSICASIA